MAKLLDCLTVKTLKHLFTNNRNWARDITERDADFFEKLSSQQRPQYLWIGCSDSRVPANQIVGLLPGEMFVHRNIANLVVHTDLNCLSVVQFAVEVLSIKDVIVCGHYGCGGVLAALRNESIGLADNWLRNVQDVRDKHLATISALSKEEERHGRLCELNVLEQVNNLRQTTILKSRSDVTVHGWIYDIKDGLLKDLCI